MIAVMTAKLTLDKAGRVVIPKPMRDELHLSSGDELEIASQGDEIILRPVRDQQRFYKKHGILVCETGSPIPAGLTDAVLQSLRDERDAQNSGLK